MNTRSTNARRVFRATRNAASILDARYDDLKNGRVQPIDGDEAWRQLKAKSDARRNHSA
jgi:hypothetical protein